MSSHPIPHVFRLATSLVVLGLGLALAGCGDDGGSGGGGQGGAGGGQGGAGAQGGAGGAGGQGGAGGAGGAGGGGGQGGAGGSSSMPSSLRFVVDTTQMADGMNLLAEVLDGEQVFLVGFFNNWNPQDPNTTLAPVDGQPGFYSITLSFPLTGADGVTYDAGSEFVYKYAKTTDDPGDAWGNGIKDVELIDPTHPCPNAPMDAVYGLFETGNYTVTVPEMPTDVPPLAVDAWRNYAEDLGGYVSCN